LKASVLLSPTSLASVQYLKFPVKGRAPIAIGIDLPGYKAETDLTEDQRSAPSKDLGGRTDVSQSVKIIQGAM
jgi:hypothetical protein